ncbi:DUF4238 domain-containing protein [Patescibacteria group bacterium]|nr:DUF4238 domain-containing protein [Patescibacteria group bacterium]
MNNPIKQHTVPNFYLKNFADKNLCVWVCDKKKKELRKQPTKDTAIINDYYTFINSSNEKDYKVEKELFASTIEKEMSAIQNKILNNLEYDDNDKKIICRFLTFQFSRTTKFKEDFEKIYTSILGETLNNKFCNEKIKRIA